MELGLTCGNIRKIDDFQPELFNYPLQPNYGITNNVMILN